MKKSAPHRRSAPFSRSRRRIFRPLAGSVAAFVVGAALWLPGAAPAASITWTAATNISADTDVSTQGTLVGAYVFGDAAESGLPGPVTNTVINGVTFTAVVIPYVDSLPSFTFGNFSLTTPDALLSTNQDGGTTTPFTNLSTGYQALLSSSVSTASNTTLTLSLNDLTIGTTYQFEWWNSASDSIDNGASFPSTATAGNAVTLSANTAGAVGGVGQFSIGTFTAGGTSEQIVFSGPELPGINGFELRTTGAAALAATNWLGNTSGVWTAANWASDASGTPTTAIPTATSDIVFSATGAGNQNTTLGANFTIHSLTINDPTAVTINSGASGPFTLTISGDAGTGITVNSGAGLVTIGANVTFAGASDTIAVNNAAGLIITGIVGGSNGLIKTGTGTLTLTGANIYLGATTIDAGTLQIGDGITTGSTIASSGQVQVGSNGTLAIDLSTGSTFANAVNNGGTVNAIASVTNTLSGIISGGGAFNQNGSGTTILTGANSYSGVTTVNAGTLQIGDGITTGSTIASSGQVKVGSNGKLAIDLSTGSTFANAVNNGGTVNAIASVTNTLSGIISGGGAFNQNGSGTTILTGANSYSGVTTVNAGTLQIGDGITTGSTIASSGQVQVGSNGKLAIDLSTGSTFANAVNNGGTINAIASVTNTLSGIISGGGAFNQNGSGTTILTGANSYSGVTTVNAGTLQIGDGITTGSTIASSGQVQVGSNGKLAIDLSTGSTFANAVNNGGTINAIASVTNTLSGIISGGGAFYQNGSGTTILTAANSYSGVTTVNAGTLQIGDGITTGSTIASSGQVQVGSNGKLAIDLSTGSTFANAVNNGGTVNAIASVTNTLSGIISGGGAFNQNGSGTTILTAANSYSGVTTVNAGTLQIGDGITTGSTIASSGQVQVGSNGKLAIDLSTGSTFANAVNNGGTVNAIASVTNTLSGIISGGGAFNQNGSGTTILTAANSYSGVTTVNAGTLQIGDGITTGSTIASSGQVQVGSNGKLAIDLSTGSTFANAVNNGGTVNAIASVTNTLSGIISGGGAFNQNGSGTTILTGANSYSGVTTVNAGTLQIGDGITTGSTIASSGQVQVGSNGKLAIDLSTGSTFANAVNNGGTINAIASVTNTLSGIISGGGAFNQNGSGTTILTGANSYSGVTTVNAGTLQIGDGITTGSTIASSGQVQIGSNGILAIDLSTGSTFANAVNDGGAINVIASGANTLSGAISGGGALNQNGSGTTSLTGINSYFGGTNINGGVLSINNGSAVGTELVTMAVGTEFNAVANITLNNTVSFATNGASTVSAASSATFTLDSVELGVGAEAIFGSAGQTGIVTVGPLSSPSVDPSATIEVAFGTLRNGGGVAGGLSFFTSQITSTTVDSGATLDVNDNSMTVTQLLGTGSVTLGSNNATVLTVNSGTFGGVISGAGQLDKETAGTLVLTGTNSYMGGTTIGGGTLQIGNGGAAGSITGDVTDNGALVFDSKATFTYAGAITGSGSLHLEAGDLTLTGANNFSGGTTIDGATTLEIGSGGATGGITGGIVDNGNLIFNHNTAYTYAGNITGAGNIFAEGGGALTLTGTTSNVSGKTTLVGTPVLINNGNALGSTEVDFGAGTELRATQTLTLANSLVLASGATSTISAQNGAVFTIQSLTIPANAAAVFGSAGNAGVVAFDGSGGGTVSVDPSATIEVAFGTLRNGNSGSPNLGFFTGSVASTTIDSGATLDLNDFSMAVKNLLGSGNVTLGSNAATNLTLLGGNFSGVISGAGQVTFNDMAQGNTLFLTGASTYMGGTTVASGTLLVNNVTGSATGSGPMTINGGTVGGFGTIGGAVTLNSGGTIAPGAGSPGVAGTILHANSLTFNGGGILNFQLGATGDQLALTGAFTKGTGSGFGLNISSLAGFGTVNDYTLVTFASTNFDPTDFTVGIKLPAGYTASLLETGASLDLELFFATSGPIIQNTAPVATPTFADFTIIGPVTTGGPADDNTINSLIFTPGGTLTISNTLTVTSGSVRTTGGNNTISGGTLFGPNGLQFNVLGNLFLEGIVSGNSTLTGGGELYLDGALVGNLQVLQGILGGNGSISGNLINAGTVSPGHSPGTLTVGGNYTQTSGGLLKIEIGGTNAGQFDLLKVGGQANLNGALQLVQLNNISLTRGEKITFLTAGQGITGAFASVSNPFTSDTILKPTVVFGPNTVSLEAIQGSFEALAKADKLAPNEVSVARALDRTVTDRRANALINYLDAENVGKLPGDFVKIDPEQLTSMFTVATALANVQSLNLQRRTDDIRSGSSGFSAAGFAMNGSSPGYSGALDITTGVAGPTGPDGKETIESKESKDVAPSSAPMDPRWGLFLSGTGDWVNVGNTPNARGYNLESGGFTLGMDYRVCEHFTIGASFGYTGTTSDLTDRGRLWVNGGKVGIYATTYDDGWYIDTAVNGGYNSFDTRREALQGEARADTDGGELNALFGTGYDFKKGALTFGPTATFNYTYAGLDSFTEQGSLAPLNIHGSDEESLRTAVGFKLSYDCKIGGLLVKPQLRAAWQHEFGDTAYTLDSSFANGAGGIFPVEGPKIGRDSALVSGGFAIQCSERSSIYLYYDGELGRTNYHVSSVSGGFRIDF